MSVRHLQITLRWGLIGALLGALSVPAAWAVPSFSRQTGLACNACHITPPELTQFGRMFKLNGYTLTGMKQISVKPAGTTAGLSLNEALPVSAMLQVADTAMRKPVPGTQNHAAEFPQQFSLFLAGELAPHVGSFMQLTYSGPDDHFGMDNTDFRIAGQGTLGGKSVVYGATLNNNPTVEDLWNSTPAWGYPYVGPDTNNGPNSGPFIQDALGTDVLGLGGYAMFDNHLYGNFTLYRSAHLGEAPAAGGSDINIARTAPYWRAAWQQDIGSAQLEVGTFGMHLNSFPSAVTGPTDKMTDKAIDFQLIAPAGGGNLISLHGVYTDESDNLAGSVALGNAANAAQFQHNTHVDATYHFGDRVTIGAGFFGNTGSIDAGLYPDSGDETGSVNNSPDNSGWVIQGGYWLDQNIELTAQFTGYHKFNGGTLNYNGQGRNASDNNTIYLMAWFLF